MQSKHHSAIAGVPSLASVLLLCAALCSAQTLSQSGSQQQQSAPGGVMIDPSAAPLKPSPAQPEQAPLPNEPQPAAPAPEQRQQTQSPPPQPLPQKPLGAAAAEQVRTAGGGASRPAGNAIAPVKQRRYRSLAIKLGAAAAAAAAAGIVYGLSRATPSTPPHPAGTVAAR